MSTFLGEPYRFNKDTWELSFDCPACAEEKGLEDGDGKHNLEVSIKKKVFQCWACSESNNMHGRISTLIKRYGTPELLKAYREELKAIKSSLLYQITFASDYDASDDEFEENLLDLPQGVCDFTFTNPDYYERSALSYLYSRGITDRIIKFYGMKFTRNNCPDKTWNMRVLIPSYDAMGLLNYFAGRDYTGKTKISKYKNADIAKKEIIFSEGKINWDATITLVEGPFDHIVTPNSIPLLGKILKNDFALYKELLSKANADIRIFLDNDAEKDAIKVYNLLNQTDELKGRVKVVPTPLNYDPSLLFQHYGYKGICSVLSQAKQI